MGIDKEQIIEVLTSRGEEEKAMQADERLPDQVDPAEHAEVLDELGFSNQGQLGNLADEG
ncbi:MAG TPA: hypothetical protein VFJ12_04095 [Segeticoccus sp.]|jgi:hypothetical protein|nr:hypothetical protein [Segeticoccus sp.]